MADSKLTALASATTPLGGTEDVYIVQGGVSKKTTAQDIANLGGGAVDSVNGQTGVVVLDAADIGLGNVDNTSDADKPISTAAQTALDAKVDENAPIAGATNTKITYDAKGLVTAGAAATTADIDDSTNRRYVTDAQLVVIGNTSGTNTGDQTITLTGDVTGSGTGSFATAIGAGVIVNADINASAAIAVSKIAALTASRAIVTDVSGFISAATTTSTEIGYVNGVTSAIQTQLNGKQATGNYITALTGDGTATGPGSVGLTLATVNSNVGTFGSSTSIPSVTVSGKGLITAISGNAVIAPAGTLTGTTLAANVVTSSLTSLGAQSADLNMNSHKLTNVTDPTNAQDAATKAYVDASVVGLLDYRGTYDASTNLFPATGGSGTLGAVLKGDFWICSVSGTLGGTATTPGDLIIAIVDTPAQTAANWDIVDHDLSTAVTSVSGTTNRITSTGGQTPVIDISATFEALLGKVASPLSQFAPTTSAQLRGVLSDETGTGAAYFQNGDIGTPTAGVATNLTGTASGLTAGNVTTNANLTGDVTSVGNATTYNSVVPSTKGGAGSVTGVLKANGSGVVSAATSGTDYSAGTSALATGILKSTTATGALTIAVAGDFPTLNQSTTGSAATLTTTRTIWGQNFNGSANVTGNITLGTGSITMTGSIAATGARVTKGWFTNIESTNAPTINGTAATGTGGGLVRATAPAMSSITLAAGTATAGTAPLYMTSGTNLTVAVAGATEWDGKTQYFTPISTQRGIVPAMQEFYLNAALAGANVNTAQDVFGVGVSLSASTIYEFEGAYYQSKSAGTTSHTILCNFGGTATLNLIGWDINHADGPISFTTSLNPTYLPYVSSATGPAMTGAITSATYFSITKVRGFVSVNAAGTFRPQYTLSAAPGGAYSAQPGSYFKIWPIGASGANVSVGTWA